MNDARYAPNQVVISESKDGRQIAIDTTTTPGTLLHRGTESDTGEVWDVVTLEAAMWAGTTESLTIAWGGLEDSDLIVKSLTAGNGREPVVIKGRLKRGLEIRAWATAADEINVYGEVGVLEAVETV